LDKAILHTLVLFVDDIDAAAADHAKLLNGTIERRDNFITMQVGELAIGFHPADERSQSGSVVPYFVTDDLSRAIIEAEAEGYVIYRGPITVSNEMVVQLRNTRDTRIGYVQKL
jgi:predicted enzyme related to lactoylglutathione lyase